MASRFDSTLPTRPLSPWAQRFRYNTGGRYPLIEDQEIHSGLAPELPKLHPIYYADSPSQENLTKTNLETDTLYLSEAFQSEYLKGFESWQAGPLMRYVWFSDRFGLLPGGHQKADYGPVDISENETPKYVAGGVMGERKEDAVLRVFNEERIQVDEDNWLDFLKKDRWYDYVKPEPLLYGSNWSVDNPKVWDVLKISVDLVDRMMKSLIADKHEMIETILYGLMADWEDVSNDPKPFPRANVLLTRQLHRAICVAAQKPCALDYVDTLTSAEWTTRLETLMKGQVFTFIERFDESNSTWGVTIHNLRGLIALDVNPLKSLMSNEITIAERCLLHLNLTATYVDFDGLNELGYAAEQRIFGGQFYIGRESLTSPPLLGSLFDFLVNWPEPMAEGEFKITTHPQFQHGVWIHTARVPALHASRLLSSAFWDDATILRKSDNGFHFNEVFNNQTIYCGSNYWQTFNPTVIADPLPAQLHPGEGEMVAAWNERQAEWLALRGSWYFEDIETWRSTAWARVKQRQSIILFRSGFARKDEIECGRIALNFIMQIRWDRGQQHYLSRLPPQSADDVAWIYHAIGLLMAAAMPLRPATVKNLERFADRPLNFIPSIEAKAKNLQPKSITVPGRLKKAIDVGPSELFNPLTRDDEGYIEDFNHEDFLNLVDNIIHHLATSNVAVPSPWLREITRTAEDLRRQRRDVRRGTRSPDTWATWNFIVPAYNNLESRFVDGRWTVQF
ncbi:hypothetical protein F5Y12DRAFT_784898 [Xylaria sp. FL1777]|nr:hypothetical protein F5Y12DRAFT_784898 [Xylaria sp. FL1777]